MMDRRDEEDREIERLFEAAREADREGAPAFRQMVAEARLERPKHESAPSWATRFGWMSAAASVLVVAIAAWLGTQAPPAPVVPAPAPALQQVVESTPSAAPATQERPDADAAKAPERPALVAVAPEKVPDAPTRPTPESAETKHKDEHVTVDEPSLPSQESLLEVAREPVAASVRFKESRVEDVEAAGRGVPGGVPGAAPGRTVGVVGGLASAPAPADQAVPQALIERGNAEWDRLQSDPRVRKALEEAQPAPAPGFNTEDYARLEENPFLAAVENPLSTFSIDVDTASYANVRRFLNQGRRPPRDAVRIEELINYFRYDYPEPAGRDPFAASLEIADCPWNREHRLARIGLKGREIDRGDREPSNLVFLIDVSGSMDQPNKLPLLQSSLGMLVDELDDRDRVAIVVYAGASGLVLPSTPGSLRGVIRAALARLEAGGSTNGGEGLRLAYDVARRHFAPGGTNRVILATDGDFNVGVTSRAELLSLIENDARRGIFLTALGFGMGNYKDSTLELLADKGNGNYAYIDDLREARKVLVEELTGTLLTIAKDVKIQVEFNPAEVATYRLIGYENRMLRREDFNDDRKDAGEIGAGHTVTALYEIVPVSAARGVEPPPVDPLRYQRGPALTEDARRGELFTLKLRYKEPDGERSRLLEFRAHDGGALRGSQEFDFAAAVAAFGMLLRGSEHAGDFTFRDVRDLATEAIGRGPGREYRREFVALVERAAALD